MQLTVLSKLKWQLHRANLTTLSSGKDFPIQAHCLIFAGCLRNQSTKYLPLVVLMPSQIWTTRLSKGVLVVNYQNLQSITTINESTSTSPAIQRLFTNQKSLSREFIITPFQNCEIVATSINTSSKTNVGACNNQVQHPSRHPAPAYPGLPPPHHPSVYQSFLGAIQRPTSQKQISLSSKLESCRIPLQDQCWWLQPPNPIFFAPSSAGLSKPTPSHHLPIYQTFLRAIQRLISQNPSWPATCHPQASDRRTHQHIAYFTTEI